MCNSDICGSLLPLLSPKRVYISRQYPAFNGKHLVLHRDQSESTTSLIMYSQCYLKCRDIQPFSSLCDNVSRVNLAASVSVKC